MAVTPTKPAIDAHKLRADFPIFEQHFHGKPLAYLDSAVALTEATPGAARRWTSSTRPRTRTSTAASTRSGARDRRLRGRPREGARVRQRALRARDHLPPQRDRGDQPRRLLVGPEQPRPGRSRDRHRARASLELRPLAVHGQAGWARTSACSRWTTTARCGSTRWTRSRRRQRQGGRLEPRLELAGDDQRRRHARRLGARAGRDLRLRRAQAAPHRASTSRSSAPTSSPSPGTRCAARAGSASLWGRAELLERDGAVPIGGHMIRKVALEQTTWGELPHKFEAGPRRRPRRSASAPRSTTSRRSGSTRSRRRARARRVRARAAGRGAGHRPLRPACRPPRRDRHASTSATSTRTTSRRSSTWTVAIRAGTIAASR